MNRTRISPAYKEGRRPRIGYSEILAGMEVSKSDSVCEAYNEIEFLRLAVSEFLLKHSLLSKRLEAFLRCIPNVLFTLNGFFFSMGESGGEIFNEAVLDLMAKDLLVFKDRFKKGIPEFLNYCMSSLYIDLDKIRVQTRVVESHFKRFMESSHCSSALLQSTYEGIVKTGRNGINPTASKKIQNFFNIAIFLNKMSTFLYWGTLYEKSLYEEQKKEGLTGVEYWDQTKGFESYTTAPIQLSLFPIPE